MFHDLPFVANVLLATFLIVQICLTISQLTVITVPYDVAPAVAPWALRRSSERVNKDVEVMKGKFMPNRDVGARTPLEVINITIHYYCVFFLNFLSGGSSLKSLVTML